MKLKYFKQSVSPHTAFLLNVMPNTEQLAALQVAHNYSVTDCNVRYV